MKAMKAAAAGMTTSAAFAKVAETTELKPKQVRGAINTYLELAATELKKNGKFKLGGVLNMKLKKKPAVVDMQQMLPRAIGGTLCMFATIALVAVWCYHIIGGRLSHAMKETEGIPDGAHAAGARGRVSSR